MSKHIHNKVAGINQKQVSIWEVAECLWIKFVDSGMHARMKGEDYFVVNYSCLEFWVFLWNHIPSTWWQVHEMTRSSVKIRWLADQGNATCEKSGSCFVTPSYGLPVIAGIKRQPSTRTGTFLVMLKKFYILSPNVWNWCGFFCFCKATGLIVVHLDFA